MEDQLNEIAPFVLNPNIQGVGEGGAKVEGNTIKIEISPVRGVTVEEARRLRDWLTDALPEGWEEGATWITKG